MDDVVLVEVEGSIATVTMNRPAARNAVNDELRDGLRLGLQRVSEMPEVRAVILTGAGKSFCAGGDVNNMRSRLEEPAGEVAIEGWRRQRRIGQLTASLHGMDQITVAAVNGHAFGLGFDLALSCDFIVASPDAVFAASFVHRALVADGGGMYFLPRRVGLQRTKDLLFSGRSVTADEAVAMGLVDSISESGGLLAKARAFAEQYTAQSRGAIMLMKSILDRSFELSLESVAALGAEAQAISYTTRDHRASVEAFLDSRSRK